MEQSLKQLQSIFERTQEALHEFNGIITPVIEHAQDDHERLYWHHIYEEEDHRLDRLEHILPKLKTFMENGSDLSTEDGEFIRLLQDISLEKFGLHNFLEHLDLSLYTFNETDHEAMIRSLREMTANDYEEAKQLLDQLNQEFEGGQAYRASTPTDEKEDVDDRLKVEAYSQPNDEEETDSKNDEEETDSQLEQEQKVEPTRQPTVRNKLTVGSLKDQGV